MQGTSVLLTLAVLSGGLPVRSYADQTNPTWQDEAKSIFDEYGVEVVLDFGLMAFPPSQMAGNSSCEPVPEKQRAETLKRLRIDLSHYEPAFLQKYLHKVFLYRKVILRGVEYGGTYDHVQRCVYVKDTLVGGSHQHEYASGFHHELSSILLYFHTDLFPEIEWRVLNPESFKYTFQHSGWKSLKTGRTSRLGNEKLYAAGFLCDYGRLTFEDDVNTYAELLIARPILLQKIGNEHPRIKAKTALLNSFYERIGYRHPAHDMPLLLRDLVSTNRNREGESGREE